MKINFYNITVSIFLILFSFACQESEDSSSDNVIIDESTLDEDLNGNTALLTNLFFDFGKELDYTYNFYSIAGIGDGNTVGDPCVALDPEDRLKVYTFPDYLVEAKNCNDPSILCSDSDLEDYQNYIQNYLVDQTYDNLCECTCYQGNTEVPCLNEQGTANTAVTERVYSNPAIDSPVCQNSEITNENECINLGWVWFENNIDCSLMDPDNNGELEPAQQTGLINNTTIEFSLTYNDLDQLVWNADAGRYKPIPGEDQNLNDTLYISDTYNVSNYWTIINEWEDISGMVYIDHKQWNDTSLVIPEEAPEGQESADIIVDTTFTYTKKVLGLDSLMFRINSDCNNDGQWTDAEFFEDTGIDGCYDDQESGYVYLLDSDGNLTDEKDELNSYICLSDGETCQINGINDSDGNGICDSDLNGDNWQEGLSTLIYQQGNGLYEIGEFFTDRPDNGKAEIYYDIDGNGTRNGLEPFADMNCNGIYDSEDSNGGNGIWDDAEVFITSNGTYASDGELWDEGSLLFSTSQSPNQIIVNYDTNFDGMVDESDMNPEVVFDISKDDTDVYMIYLNGSYQPFSNPIVDEQKESYQYYKYTPIEEIVTIFSNQIIEDIPSELSNKDYYVTKTLWDLSSTGCLNGDDDCVIGGIDLNGDGIADRDYDYDYHLFRYSDSEDAIGPGHLLKLVHPSYFYNYGYFEFPYEIENGFYDTPELLDEIMIYTVDGEIREGEDVTTHEEVYVDANKDGINDTYFLVDKNFTVSIDSVTAPVRKVLGTVYAETDALNICSDGEMIVCAQDSNQISCPDGENNELGYNDCSSSIRDLEDCSADTLFNSYKVTRTKNITMIGNGVEFSERNTIWLVEGLGIIRDKLEHRWSGQDWAEFSTIEYLESSSSEDDFLGRMFGGYKILNVNDFENEPSLNHDPFRPSYPTSIIQRSRVHYDQ